MNRERMTDKLLILGIDAMDPRLTRKYVDMGLMPNVKQLINKGAARKDLVLLGAMPTVTPPQWTTLATGAYPETHDITAFYRQGSELDKVMVNFNSANCKAEQLWNVTARAGLKTLVWHWPGSAWPPSIDSDKLDVVDGSSPGSVNMSTGQFESEYLIVAHENNAVVTYKKGAANGSKVPCVVEAEEDTAEDGSTAAMYGRNSEFTVPIYDPLVGGQGGFIDSPLDVAFSPIKIADEKWKNAPKNAKEFTMLFSGGLIRRAALVTQDQNGIYSKIEVYRSKKDDNPLYTLYKDEYVRDIIDEAVRNGKRIMANRDLRVMELAEDGSSVKIWVSPSMDMSMNKMWHPQELHKEIVDNIGYPPPTARMTVGDKDLFNKCMHLCWEHTTDWQGKSMMYLIEKKNYNVVFSHFHAPDLQKHMFIRDMKKGRPNCSPAEYELIMQSVYTQIDRYVSYFMPLLDKEWTIMLVSDHAQVCPTYGIRGLGDTGCNLQIMNELGFTVFQKDEKGNDIFDEPLPNYLVPRIDWSKTTAVANREMHIYLNLKGRQEHGIVDPADQYELEEEIMTKLYGYKDKVSGKRIIAFALRRKDARLIGLGGEYPQCGDIIYCMAEGYEHDHDDSLSTSWGECDTSVSPIFIAAGPGIKENFETNRVIRQVDIAPTAAILLGVDIPAQCEGAPIYQILSESL